MFFFLTRTNNITDARIISTKMEKLKGKIALVTGASSGIGEEICRQFVNKGMTVIGFARRENKLMVIFLLSFRFPIV